MGYTSQKLRRVKAAAAVSPPDPNAPKPAPPLDALALHAELQRAKARIVELETRVAELEEGVQVSEPQRPVPRPDPVILAGPQKGKGRARRSR